MSRWTWMECIIWVSAIAAISSISRPQTDFSPSHRSNMSYTELSSFPSQYPARRSLHSPKCQKPGQKLLGFRWSLLAKSASELACK